MSERASPPPCISVEWAVTIGERIRAWREYRRLDHIDVESRARLAPTMLEAIEKGNTDPTASTVEAIASVLEIPSPWLYGDPRALIALVADPDGDPTLTADIDPVTADILRAAPQQRHLFALLARLVHAGDEKLLRAAQVNLASLVKQIPRTTVPWGTRPPGHFEPPAD